MSSFKQIFEDIDGTLSSKRAATLVCLVLITTAFISNLFFGFKIEEFIYESVVYIAIAGLGFVGAEKFAPKKKGSE